MSFRYHLNLVCVLASVFVWSTIGRPAPAAERLPDDVLFLYPDIPPGSEGVIGAEEIIDRATDGLRNRIVANVHRPTISVYLPPKGAANGTAVVILPGGGFTRLAIDKEGHEVARWFNSLGVAGIVVKYRLPRSTDHFYGMQVAIDDVQRAIRMTRHNAEKWNIRSDRIGVMGFSAGGYLTTAAGTMFDSGTQGTSDRIDRQSSRPDFLMPIYPVIAMSGPNAHPGIAERVFGDSASKELAERYSPNLRVTADTPPAFLVTTSDDRVKAEHSIAFYLALRQFDIPAELHVYESGGHGYGLRPTGHTVDSWPTRCKAWLAKRGLLD